MNMNLADMNNVIMNLAHQEKSGLGSRSEGRIRGKGADFSSRLDREIQKMETPEDFVAGQDKGLIQLQGDISKRKNGLKSLSGLNAAPIAQEGMDTGKKKNGLKFLSDLENIILQLSGGDMNTVSINSEGLDSLKKILILAGFDPDQVTGMIDQLKEAAGEKAIELGMVMDSLSLLETSSEEVALTEEVFLETSALPFIVTLLDSFGLPKDFTGAIMEKADKGPEGISLDVVAEELKTMVPVSGRAPSSLEFKANTDTVHNLLGQLNMTVPDNTGAENLTLKELISAFDTYIKSEVRAREPMANTSVPETDRAMEISAGSLVDKLFDSFTRLSEKSNPVEFSFHQVKDQFENELMIPEKGQKVKNSLFSQNHSNAMASPDTFLKEIEAVLSKSGTGETKGESDGRSGFQRESKTEQVKIVDISQGGTGQGKNDVGENMVNALKGKPPERALPFYVTQQVNKSIVRAVNQGDTTLRLQLKPASLGRLMLTIDNVGNNTLKVSIVTENHAAKEMLALNVNELKTALGSAGISLDSFEVDMSSDFKQSLADTGNPAGNFNRKNGRKGHPDSDGEDLDMENNLAGISGGMPMDGSYHFVA